MEADPRDELEEDSDDETDNSCVVCYDSMLSNSRSQVTLVCGHKFHFACVGTYFNRIKKMECPYCRKVNPNGSWKVAQIPLSDTTESKFPDTIEDTLGTLGCSICSSEFDSSIKPDVVLAACGHKFHFDCLGEYCNYKNRVECPICHTLEGGDWWHCPYGIHSSDVLEGGNDNVRIETPVLSSNSARQGSERATNENEDRDYPETDSETMGLLERGDSEDEDDEMNLQRFGTSRNTNLYRHCFRLLKKWFIAWTRGAQGEIRLLRLLIIAMLVIAGILAINSHVLNGTKRDGEKGQRRELLILYILSATVPMLFCPGLLMPLPAILYSALLAIKIIGHYYDSSLDLILEPISSIGCLFMMLYWIRCNRIPTTTATTGGMRSILPRLRPLGEIYSG